MKRIEAIRGIVRAVTDEAVISSTGMISRELYAVMDRDRNFYMLGSMGSALGIGLGIAINSSHKVIVISGDAAALMSLGTLALHRKLHPPNLKHYILDNNCCSSTGGQPTCSDAVDFASIAPNTYVIKVDKDKGSAPRIPMKPNEIMVRFMYALGTDNI
ncbi:MAG: thiamine pyrophosphate-dependent enzyme [Candidatus Omnitrophota bacterium]|jgi:thiamine pyrophosphate-dependent acetolactate synthase large subunit-like protein